MWEIFCVVGIVYTLILVVMFIGKGISQVIWPVLIGFSIFLFKINPITEIFMINETLIPTWIFTPRCLLVAPISAIIIFTLLTFAKK